MGKQRGQILRCLCFLMGLCCSGVPANPTVSFPTKHVRPAGECDLWHSSDSQQLKICLGVTFCKKCRVFFLRQNEDKIM